MQHQEQIDSCSRHEWLAVCLRLPVLNSCQIESSEYTHAHTYLRCTPVVIACIPRNVERER